MKQGPATAAETACIFRLLALMRPFGQLPMLDEIDEDHELFRSLLHGIRVERMVYSRARSAANSTRAKKINRGRR